MNGHVEKRVSERTGAVTWCVRLFVDKAHGGPKRKAIGSYPLKREAEAALAAALARYHAGTYRETSTMTVAELCERWLRDGAAPKARPSTMRYYRMAVDLHIVPDLGDMLAEMLTPADVAAWQAMLARSGRTDGRGGLSPKSVRWCRGALHNAYTWAVKLGELRTNPVATCDPPPLADRDLEPPSAAELIAFLDAIRDTRYHLPVLIAVATGMRRGEVLGLDWQHVDLERGVVHVRQQKTQAGRAVAIASLKTRRSRRDLPLPEWAIEELRAARSTAQHTSAVAGVPWSERSLVCGDAAPNNISTGLQRLAKSRHLPPLHMHLLRHAKATRMLRQGDNPGVVQHQLGHSSLVTTVGTYGHVSNDDLRAANERDGDAFSAIGHQTDTKSGDVISLKGRRPRKTPA
ncbi:MAG: tyrosine-type recombinase/integrase [Thermoleophilia bacterium]